MTTQNSIEDDHANEPFHEFIEIVTFDSDSTRDSSPTINYFSFSRLPIPLGPIIYEENKIELAFLKDQINYLPEFIAFVNEVQQSLFNGTRKEIGRSQFFHRDLILTLTGSS